MSKTDSRYEKPPYKVLTPWAETTLFHIGNPAPYPQLRDFVSVRLTFEDRSLEIFFPADAPLTDVETGKELKGDNYWPGCMFEWGVKITKITEGQTSGGELFDKGRDGWGRVIFKTGAALSYAGARGMRHSIEETILIRLATEMAKKLKAVNTAQSASPRGARGSNAKEYQVDFDKRIIWVGAQARQLTANQNALIRYFWQDKETEGKRYFHTSFQAAATEAGIASRNMSQVFKAGQQKGGNLDIMRSLFRWSTREYWILEADLKSIG